MRSPIALRALLAVTLLVGVAGVRAQNITVTAANASNDSIYNVFFNNTGGGSTTVLNTDQGSLHSLTSLAFLSNPGTFALDLLAADNAGGLIVRYPGDFRPTPTTGSVVFAAGGAVQGPSNPDGFSVDAAGDLFVVNSKSGTTSNPQLWVLPGDGAGNFGNPVQLDANYASTEVLVDTLIVPTTITLPGLPQLNPGDLLVLTSNPSFVLLYPGTAGHGPLSATHPPTPPIIWITLPVGTVPGGLAFWPPDNTLLVTNSRGTINQYAGPTANPIPFANGLGNGQFKIKTGIQSGVPYAYVANNNGGDILQFSGPQINGQNQLRAVVTAGVQHPQGLAVTNVNYASFTNCEVNNTCDLLGGAVITHHVPKNITNNNIIEDICFVPVDPRLAAGGCNTPLPVSQVCPGFSNTNPGIVIPASLCGSSGQSGQGFALIKTLVNAPAQLFDGSLVFNDSNLTSVLQGPNTSSTPCVPGTIPVATLAWAPLAGEGIVIESNNLVEVTSGCDGGTSGTRKLSLFGVGLALNIPMSGLPNFAGTKYVNLSNPSPNQPPGTLQNEVTAGALTPPIAPSDTMGQSSSVLGNFTYTLQQCIATSQAAFLAGATNYGRAAVDLLRADQLVTNNLASFTSTPPNYPNPSGELRWRLQNLYYTINTRISGNQASSQPPPPPYAPPPPTITGTPATKANGGTLYSFQPNAADFTGTNHGTLTFSIVGQPSWARLDTTSGRLFGIAVKGTYSGIVITVTDGCASASLPAFSIKVTG